MESADLAPPALTHVPCQRHPQQPVAAACQRCGDYVCLLCENRRQNRIFCPDCASPAEAPLASKSSRLGGHLIDHVLIFVPAGGVAYWQMAHLHDPNSDTIYAIGMGFSCVMLAVNLVTLYSRGQSLGKMAVGTRIVTMSYQRASLWQLLLRALVQLFTLSAGVVNLISALMILGGEARRGIHDYAAGTRVVRAAESAHLYGRTSSALPMT